MKRTILTACLAVLIIYVIEAQVKIGDNPNTIDPNSLLELESTNKGFLAPRMTQANRLALSTPPEGLLLYQTDSVEGFYYYKNSAWATLASGVGTQWSSNGSHVYYSGGNIGIGTSSPAHPFNVKATSPTTGGLTLAKFEAIQNAGSGNYVNIQLTNNSTTSTKTFMLFGGASSNLWAMGNDLFGTNAQNYYVYDVNAFSTRLLIDGSGRTGIGTETPNSVLHVEGSLSLPLITVTANYTATTNDYVILCNTGSMTITLPSASAIKGRIYVIKKIASTAGTITIDPSGSETIEGAATTGISAQYQSFTIQSDGANWFILSTK